MIEDALKAARNIHRLIISVSLLTVVFALSVELPKEKVQQLEELENLAKFPFMSYDNFVEAQVEKTIPTLVEKRIQYLEQVLEGPMIFDLSKISEAAKTPVHIGKIESQNLVFSKVQDASLSNFDAITSVLSRDRPIQLWLPKIEALEKDLKEFFAQHPQAGGRISNVRLELAAESDVFGESEIETFIDVKEIWAQIYFELIPADGPIGTPVFTAPIPAELYELPASSWKSWFLLQENSAELVETVGNDLRWLPKLKKRPNGFDQQEIGVLISKIKEDLQDLSPEENKMTVLGSEVPGILVIYASPLILLALAYYLRNHLGHLQKLVEKSRADFKDFAWMPLSLGKSWKYESFATIIGIPILSVVTLNIRLSAFGDNRPFSITLAFVAVAVAIFLGYSSIKRLAKLRNTMAGIAHKDRHLVKNSS